MSRYFGRECPLPAVHEPARLLCSPVEDAVPSPSSPRAAAATPPLPSPPTSPSNPRGQAVRHSRSRRGAAAASATDRGGMLDEALSLLQQSHRVAEKGIDGLHADAAEMEMLPDIPGGDATFRAWQQTFVSKKPCLAFGVTLQHPHKARDDSPVC